ncbi:hypothetical protein [Winogradskyella forsetii]|uniref:hypothetical protein n=1 Tax=Winogradskyella forsetii TaxID=2686077 RepID=UPI0015B83C68|nr:hypothetical protein [Winogradskyella forsetii]
MGNKKKAAKTVKVKRGNTTKEIPFSQWKAYGDNTYGWKLASDVSDETANKEAQIEKSQITELQGQVKTLSEENDSLKSESATKDTTITELQGQVKTLTDKVSDLESSDKKEAKKTETKAASKKS